jgi:GTPase
MSLSSLPSVAIVGRPNVGKSTLYNRLTATRDALVSDLPGLTRDRREGEADLNGRKIRLIDTAGLEVATRGSIQARMREQSELAIQLADLVLFVIDARDGVTGADETFAKIARSSGKPVILVANKCEGKAASEGFYDAFQMGFGDPVGISAEHGEGISDLKSDVLAALGLAPVLKARGGKRAARASAHEPEIEVVERPSAPIRVAIVGRPNAGKSTLVNALIGEDRMIVGPEPGLTRDSISTDVTWAGRTIRLFDTAGLRRKVRISEKAEQLSASDAVRAIRFAEVVVLLLDADRAFEQQDLTIGDMVIDEGRSIVVAVNKWDLVEDKQKRLKDLREMLEETFTLVPGVALVTLSAKSGKGVDKLQKAVMDAHEIWNKRVATNALNRWLDDALTRHAPPAASGRRIKIRYITQPSSRPPTFVAWCSQPKGLPKAYTRYLINSLRDAFGLPGVPIRFNLRKSENPFAKDGR